jgi:pimeloyl-ACP methyl ester carboxylesterase
VQWLLNLGADPQLRIDDLFFSAADGTQLHAVAQRGVSSRIPLVCLPGLTRSTRDFAPVFKLVKDRDIIAFDFRGRGKSAWADTESYRPDVELADTLAFLDYLGVGRVAVLGTSRGGLVGMLMAAMAGDRVAALMLNDIGPVIEVEGLKRIAGYVGKTVRFPSWDAAAMALAWSSAGFENMSHDDWLAAARMIYAETDGLPVTDHDPGLARNFPSIEKIETDGVPDMWSLVPALKDVPVALLRGQGSDLLSRETVTKFQSLCPALVATEIPDRGHVPFLDERASQKAILDWLRAVDGAA